MERIFARFGRAVVRRRWLVFTLWVALLVFGVIFAPRLQEVFEREFVAGSTGESQQVASLIASELRGRSPYQQQLVFTSESLTVDDPEYRQAAEAVIDAADSTGLISNVDSYFSSGDRSLVSADGRTTYAILGLRSKTHADGMAASGKLLDAVGKAKTSEWLKAYATGEETTHADLIRASQESLQKAEMVGLPVALVVLVFVFGGLLAAGLPLAMGVLSIIIALALAFLVGQWMDLSNFMENIVAMLGLGVGIDYALFVLTRYRAERKSGKKVDDAVIESVTHAGKAIAFSGLTVMIGLSALSATGEISVISMGVGGILVVLVTVAAALTLLPASLSVLGDRIELPRYLSRLIGRAHPSGFWQRWATMVMRRPIPYAVFGLAVIALLAWPALTLKTGSIGVKLLGEDAQSRQGFEVLAKDFGSSIMSPVQIVVRSDSGIGDPQTVAGIYHLTKAIEADRRFTGVVSVTSIASGLGLQEYQALYANNFARVPDQSAGQLRRLVNLDRGANTTMVLAFLSEDPGSDSSNDAVRVLRKEIIPSVSELRDDRVLVGGTTAMNIDMIDALYARFPVVIGLILIATFVLLLVLFRSVLIPLKAVLMNLFSVSASYGLLALVFQKGIGDELLGFSSVGFVNSMTPVLLFAVLFGLSMDYEVFLMSRMRELRDLGHTNEESVAIGMERTGGVITGAAVIMIVVFASFTLSPIIVMKELGFALAVAVLLDATVVRLVLVPAMMRLFGNWNWWLPSFLAKSLPEVKLERGI